jgi:hypothetical protein
MALAIAIDFFFVKAQGGPEFCISGAYGFLIPAYAALFAAGRWLASRWDGHFSIGGLASFALAALVGIAAAELLSGGSFYWLGGFTQEASLSGMFSSFAKYVPIALQNTGFYLAVALVAHFAIQTAAKSLSAKKV